MAIELASNPATNNSKNAHGTVHHCEYIAQSLKVKSQKAAQLAEQHEQMARTPRSANLTALSHSESRMAKTCGSQVFLIF